MTPAAREVRKDILRVAGAARHGHVPSCFSVVEILLAVYGHMRHDPARPRCETRDLFILSKGHAALAHYCVLARLGYFSVDDVLTLGGYASSFGCHADRLKVPGVEASTGSLGHGIGLAVGMALGLKIRRSDRRVYAVVGDGEANEGAVWEAVLAAESLGLSNLTVIYDNNLSHARGLQVPHPERKFEAFGFHVAECDGHDIEALRRALAAPGPGPKAVVAHTSKGRGVKAMVDNHYAWHGRIPNGEEIARFSEELDAAAV